MPNLLDPNLVKTFAKDKELLETTKIPLVTVSASYKEDIKGFHDLPENEKVPDVVFSRAHYSMALGIAVAVWGSKGDLDGFEITKDSRIDPSKLWLVDPTNYVSHKEWRSIAFTEFVGKTLARRPILKRVKDLIDSFGRSKLPILGSITPPLLHLFQNVDTPILSLHIATGNILMGQGKRIIQVCTDPHVRDEYLTYIDNPNYTLCVFDHKTKTDVLEKSAILGKVADPDRVIVTGPPIDPRIIAARRGKHAWRNGPVKLCITTGGLGTNKAEIRELLEQLLPVVHNHPDKFQLLVFAGTHDDIRDMVEKMARAEGVKIGKDYAQKASLRLLYHPQIVDANELLVKYGFPWADGFITKPSGDMAYDAVAAGCFLLTLQEWGVWEQNIRQTFEQEGVARRAETSHILEQLHALTEAEGKAQSWVEQAMHQASNIDKLYLNGAKEIIKTVRATK